VLLFVINPFSITITITSGSTSKKRLHISQEG
jgi:hypothetical protein